MAVSITCIVIAVIIIHIIIIITVTILVTIIATITNESNYYHLKNQLKTLRTLQEAAQLKIMAKSHIRF